MEATDLATNPLVYYAGTGNQFRSYLPMRCDGDAGNQELVEALQLQGSLIGNLEHEKARMTAQFNLLDQELTRGAREGTLATTVGTPSRSRKPQARIDRQATRPLAQPNFQNSPAII